MLRELMFKWFGLEELPCNTCEVLRAQLDESNRERRDLLNRLLEPTKPEPPSFAEVDLKPVGQTHVPWRVRQQMLEAEDRKAAELLKAKEKEMQNHPRIKDIEELEKELGLK